MFPGVFFTKVFFAGQYFHPAGEIASGVSSGFLPGPYYLVNFGTLMNR